MGKAFRFPVEADRLAAQFAGALSERRRGELAILQSERDRNLEDYLSATVRRFDYVEKGDLLVATGSGRYERLAAGDDRRVLIADSAVASGMKWDWPRAGAPGFNAIEMHDHGTEGFIHFYSDLASESFHGNLYQDTRGVGGTAQSEVVMHSSEHNFGWSASVRLVSQSVDGTIPASVELGGNRAVVGPGHNPVNPADLVQKSYVDSAVSGVVVPAAGSVISTEYAFGQVASAGSGSGFYSRSNHTHGTPANPVLTNHPRFLAVDGINPNTQQVQMQSGNTVVTTNATGGASIGYGATFSNDTLSVTMTNGDVNTHPDAVFSADIGGANVSGFGLRVRVGGANLANQAIRICWTAVGY